LWPIELFLVVIENPAEITVAAIFPIVQRAFTMIAAAIQLSSIVAPGVLHTQR
jgi:hypothetical protein